MQRLYILLLVAIGISGCIYNPWARAELLCLETEDLYQEAHKDRIAVTITNIFEAKIQVRRLIASTRDRFYEKTDVAVLEPDEQIVIQIPYTPQFLQGNEVAVEIRYAHYDTPANRWPPADQNQTARVSERVTIDSLKFPFPQARKAAGFNPKRYFHMKRWSNTWVFEARDGRTVFLNGINQHSFQGPWYDIAQRVERSDGQSVALEFRTPHPNVAEALRKEYAATQDGNVLSIALQPKQFIPFIRAVKAAGYILTPGAKDGTLKKKE